MIHHINSKYKSFEVVIKTISNVDLLVLYNIWNVTMVSLIFVRYFIIGTITVLQLDNLRY